MSIVCVICRPAGSKAKCQQGKNWACFFTPPVAEVAHGGNPQKKHAASCTQVRRKVVINVILYAIKYAIIKINLHK